MRRPSDGRRYGELVVPLILIVAGVIALLANTHALSQQAIDNLIVLWPLILVVGGAALVLRSLLPPRTATLASLAVLAVALIAGLAVAIAGPALAPAGTGTLDRSAALTSTANASASLDIGSATVTVQAADLGAQAFRAHLEYPAGEGQPDVRFDASSNALRVTGGVERPFTFFQTGNRRLDLTLSTRVAWSIAIGGGSSDVTLTLTHLQLTGLQIGGGSSNLDATLPAAHGTVGIEISGGSSNVTVHLPRGTAWHVAASGGSSSVQVDGRTLNGDNTVSQSRPGYDTAQDRYDLEISGGSSHVVIDSNGSSG
ncbi:MAG TPA: hypothetical protein VET26_09835 [Candidatus Sulfotelmatobacter sp.]|nr:hypothetical protein [Candidatus Sulfotelmatobacter sp.]